MNIARIHMLMKYKKEDLQELCRQYNIDPNTTKTLMAMRIDEVQSMAEQKALQTISNGDHFKKEE